MPSSHAFRPDIEGLRAIAVLLVLLYHADVSLLGGGFLGVDVFFVISGYLITRSLINEAEHHGAISLSGFYARRVRRLLPAAATVLTATAIGTRVLLPATAWRDFGGDIVSAAAYVVNWRLSARSVDYLAEDVASSPVQHFWSLSVEEQFYFVWPLLIVAGLVLARRLGWRTDRTMLWLLVIAVLLPSFVWSVVLTSREPSSAFFATGTRLWELAIGAVAAVIAPSFLRIPPWVRTVVRSAALAAIVAMSMAVSEDYAWPGALALGATLPTAMLILFGERAGDDEQRDTIDRVLAVRPMQRVGAWSYSLYLWHWPPVAILSARWGGLELSQSLLIVALSTLPAVASYHLIENPLRYWEPTRSSPRLALSLGANLSLVGMTVGLVLVLMVPSTGFSRAADSGAPDATPTASDDELFGAPAVAQLIDDEAAIASLDRATDITPPPTLATDDIPRTYPDGCHVRGDDTEAVACEYGDRDGEIHLAIVGDSKAGQWATALIDIADRRGWRLTNLTRSACALSTTTPTREGEPDAACRDWGANVLEWIEQDTPDLVLVSQAAGVPGAEDPTEHPLVSGMVDAYQRIERAGATVAILMDNPHPGMAVYECVAQNPSELIACTFERPDTTPSRTAQTEAAEIAGFTTIDLLDWICPTPTCLPVIGDVLVYRQGSHLTGTYVATLAPMLEQRIIPVLRSALSNGI